jgi:hypothetical protein
MGRMGRRTRLTASLEDQIVTAVRSGAPLEVAAQAVGVPPSTFWEWMARGEGRGTRPATRQYADFAERVRKAEAEVHVLTVGAVRQAVTRGNWQASLAWMRLRWPKHYAERSEVSGPEGRAIPLEIVGLLEGMSDEDLDAISRRLRNPGPGGGGAGEAEEDPAV